MTKGRRLRAQCVRSVLARSCVTKGSIPAQAGEPTALQPAAIGVRVHPRAGGGAADHVALLHPAQHTRQAVESRYADATGAPRCMIVIDYCRLERHDDGREYVMVRFGFGEPTRFVDTVQVTKEYWQGFIAAFKPMPSMLQVNERTLEEWALPNLEAHRHNV
jgi:hypothetical protein